MCINNLFNVTISPIIRPIFLPLVFVIKSAKKNFSIASANSGAAVRIDFCHCHLPLSLSLFFYFQPSYQLCFVAISVSPNVGNPTAIHKKPQSLSLYKPAKNIKAMSGGDASHVPAPLPLSPPLLQQAAERSLLHI